jgi:hypothetical protein
METNTNTNVNNEEVTPVTPAQPTETQTVTKVAKKSYRGRPPKLCSNLDKYMAKQYPRLLLEDVQCAANLMAQWVEVKMGNATPESARYVAPPEQVKVAKVVEKTS